MEKRKAQPTKFSALGGDGIRPTVCCLLYNSFHSAFLFQWELFSCWPQEESRLPWFIKNKCQSKIMYKCVYSWLLHFLVKSYVEFQTTYVIGDMYNHNSNDIWQTFPLSPLLLAPHMKSWLIPTAMKGKKREKYLHLGASFDSCTTRTTSSLRKTESLVQFP